MLADSEVRDVVDALQRGDVSRLNADVDRRQAFPGSVVPVVSGAGESLEVRELSWGFATDWGKGLVFNTRIESALGGTAMWRDAFRDGRCIVPAAAFFEPHRTEKATSPRTGKPVKRPYVFQDAEGLPLLLAGVAAEGKCSIVTCEPNRWVSPVHPRMPLALRFEEVPQWLEGEPAALAALTDRSAFELVAAPELQLASTKPPVSSNDLDQPTLF